MVAKNSMNPDDFCLPDLGEGLEEAELVEWCVHVGQRVKENDLLAKMETAKALVDVPSPRNGVIATLHGHPGQSIKVGSPLVTYMAEVPAVAHDGNGHAKKVEADDDFAEQVAEHVDSSRSAVAVETRIDAGTVVGTLGEAPGVAHDGGRALAAPAVRRLARDLGVDIDHVAGTGIGGRVTTSDVEAAARQTARTPTPPHRQPDPAAPRRPTAGIRSTRIPFRGVRRTIAEHLRNSISHAVHFTVMDEADVTALETTRRKLVAAANEKISLLPFVAFAVCRVLTGRAAYARLNSTVDDDAQEIIQHSAVHLGIATDTDIGLMVPVIPHCERLGVLEISRRIAELARAARDRTLKPEQMRGSTFTISNFGSIGGRFGTPIINYPEAAILAVGRAREGVVVRHGMLGVGRLLPLSLSADHRVIDGAAASTAVAKIIELLQSPEDLMPTTREEL